MTSSHKRTAGFTIIELMIATVVFTIVLLVLAGAIVQIGRLYYKGITAARTQAASRSISDAVTQAIQFNGGEIYLDKNDPLQPANKTRAACIGSEYFMYLLKQQQLSGKHAITTRTLGSACSTTSPTNMASVVGAAVPGTEQLGERMRLSNFKISQVAGSTTAYDVLVRVVYGDADLLCVEGGAAGTPADCSSTLPMNETDVMNLGENVKLRCKNIKSGTQFCAVSELSTVVERRISK